MLEMVMQEKTKHIWENFSDQLRAFILSKTNIESVVDDILQDVFLKIHSNINTLKEEEKLKSWIYQITRNCINDYYRKNAKPFSDIDNETNFVSIEEEEINQNKEKLKTVKLGLQIMIDELPGKYAQALKNVELDGMSQKELANSLGISVSGAKSRVQRGRQMIKDTLLDCCDFQFDKYGTFIDYKPRKIDLGEQNNL